MPSFSRIPFANCLFKTYANVVHIPSTWVINGVVDGRIGNIFRQLLSATIYIYVKFFLRQLFSAAVVGNHIHVCLIYRTIIMHYGLIQTSS